MLLAAFLALQDPEIRPIAEAAARGDYAAAEALALDRVKREPPSALAWFYLGFSRAARERFAEAVEPYQKALELGLADPKVRFQLGYAAHRAGRHDVAVPALRAFLEARPGDVEARVWLGASLLETGARAEAAELLAPVADAEGPWQAAARALLEVEKPPSTSAPARPWSAQVLLKAGYDSNVLLLSDTSQARGSDEGAAFAFAFASGGWDDGTLFARGGVLGVRYDDLAEADVDAFLLEAGGRAELSDVLRGRVSLHADVLRLGHDPLSRRAGPEAALLWRVDPALSLEAALRWTWEDYRPDELEDLDGGESEARLEAAWSLGTAKLRAAYRLLLDDAAEEDFDVLGHRGEARLDWAPAKEVELRLEAWLAGEEHGDGERRDLRRGARLSAAWILSGRVRLFAEVELERNASTLGDFDYSRRSAAAGVAFFF